MEMMNMTTDNPMSAAMPQQQNKASKKKTILIIAVILSCTIIAAGIIATILLNTKADPAQESTEDDFYLVDDDDLDVYTGGEDEELPEDQDINFLAKYGITEEDTFYVEEKILEVADEYYEDDGYNEIYYNTTDVKVSNNGNKVFFTAYTDWADRNIEVTVYLVNGEVDTVEIY